MKHTDPLEVDDIIQIKSNPCEHLMRYTVSNKTFCLDNQYKFVNLLDNTLFFMK